METWDFLRTSYKKIHFYTSKWWIKLRWRQQPLFFFSFGFHKVIFQPILKCNPILKLFIVRNTIAPQLAQQELCRWSQYSRWRFYVYPSVRLSLVSHKIHYRNPGSEKMSWYCKLCSRHLYLIYHFKV
jgi:hypothetical protein